MNPNLFWLIPVALVLWGEWKARHKGDRMQFLTYWIRKIPLSVRLVMLALLVGHFFRLCGGDFCV